MEAVGNDYVLVVRVIQIDFDEAWSSQLICLMKLGGDERRGDLRHSLDVPFTWPYRRGNQNDLTVSLVKKRLIGWSRVCGTGSIPVAELAPWDRSPVPRWFQLEQRGLRVGKVMLEIGVRQQDDPNHIRDMHMQLLGKLSQGGGPSSSMSVSSSFVVTPKEGTIATTTNVGLDDSDGLGYVCSEEEIVPGYQDKLWDEQQLGGVLGEQSSKEGEEDDDDNDDDDDDDDEQRFQWVLGATRRQMEDAAAIVSKWWQRVKASDALDEMAAVFFDKLGRNGSIAKALLEGEEKEGEDAEKKRKRRKEKFIGLIERAVSSVANTEGVLQEVKDVAIRLVGHGMLLGDYGAVGVTLLHAMSECDSAQWNNQLEHAWSLVHTMVSTTMMEAARPMYARMGKLPPGLELLGGDGAFPPIFYHYNERFQSAVEAIWKDEGDDAAWSRLADVCDDFEEAAADIGRLIISERFIPEAAKTIKPVTMSGGVIGGVKYCQHGLFFKFALPDGKFILTSEAAEKVAGHELKNCSSYFRANVHGIHVPLMTCIDFAGFRLSATCVLPISKDTLVLGTPDGGKVIRASDSILLRLMMKAARRLNLKEHSVGNVKLYECADLEGHFSPTDARRYVLDFSRAMPPDIESIQRAGVAETVYTRLLRPELVWRNKEPLNPDAFSGFRGFGADEERLFANDCEQVRMASVSIQQACQDVAEALMTGLQGKMGDLNLLKVELDSLSRAFHSRGVNMRYLGQVYRCSRSRDLSSLLLVEMASRVMKHLVKQRWRHALSTAGYAFVGTLHRVTAEAFNDIFNPFFWESKVFPEIERYFEVEWPHEALRTTPLAPSSLSSSYSSTPTSGTTTTPSATRPRAFSGASIDVGTVRIGSVRGRVARSESASSIAAALQSTRAPLASLFRLALELLVYRLCRQLGVELSERVLHDLALASPSHPVIIDGSDVLRMQCRRKSLNISSHAKAMSLLSKVRRHPDNPSHWLSLASNHFERALDSPLVSPTVLCSYAHCLILSLLHSINISPSKAPPSCLAHTQSTAAWQQIDRLYMLALGHQSGEPLAHVESARWNELTGRLDEAKRQWLQGLLLAPMKFVMQHGTKYVEFLRRSEMHAEALAIQQALLIASNNA